MDEQDRRHLTHAVDLAEAALEAGDEPFGSVLVDAAGTVLRTAVNEAVHRNATIHPELTLAQWAGDHLDPDARTGATVYTSGEHCPMCSAAHAWVGLGRIVYASSSAQTARWVAELGGPPSPVAALPITTVAPGIPVEGPDEELAARVRELHRRFRER
ncbi:nucleoside deaminase [Microlunatus spumicola]|uniref:Nucleoside deaminase n=1 Tax=Microlunatus spumicola TaxID=81499 RepID=A0ABP6XDK9_9ACTN